MSNKSLTNVPEQNHDAMRGGALHGSVSDTHEPIPGERDASTLTHRQPGSMSAPFNGADATAQAADPTLEEQTVVEHWREGGGADGERQLKKQGGR